MRKETALAIFAGISIGLIAAFGIWKATSSIKKNVTSTTSTKTPTVISDKNVSFTISNLSDFDIFTESFINILGTAKPFSNIVVSTTENDFFGKSEEDGSFKIEVELPVGLSIIKIVSFDSDGNSTEIKIKLIYSSEFKKYVEESKKSKGYVGTVTDISEGTIQIKGAEGEILQAGFNEDTVFVNSLKKDVIVKNTDLAIGDYIIAMGILNGNKVLSTKRVLITSELVDEKREIVWGKLTQITSKKLTVTNKEGQEINITLPKSWNGPDIKDLEENQTVITSNILVGETYTLRSIFTPVE